MEKKQFDNENFVLYSPDSLIYITKDLEELLDNSLKLDKSKLVLICFGSMEVYEKAIKDGFNVVSID